MVGEKFAEGRVNNDYEFGTVVLRKIKQVTDLLYF